MFAMMMMMMMMIPSSLFAMIYRRRRRNDVDGMKFGYGICNGGVRPKSSIGNLHVCRMVVIVLP